MGKSKKNDPKFIRALQIIYGDDLEKLPERSLEQLYRTWKVNPDLIINTANQKMVYDQVDNKGIIDTVNRNRVESADRLHSNMYERWWDDLIMPVYSYSEKQKIEDTAKKLSQKSEPKPLSFGEAFKAARKAGEKTFVWNGKTYGTKLKEEVEGDQKAEKSDTSKEDSKSELVSKRTPVIEVSEPVSENPWVVYAPPPIPNWWE